MKKSSRKRVRLLVSIAILLFSTTLLVTTLNLMNGNMQVIGPIVQIGNTGSVKIVVKYVNGSLNLVLPLQTNYTESSNRTLFLIIGRTGTSYVRNFIGEKYFNGLWFANLTSALEYKGDKLAFAAPKYVDSETEKIIIIKPFTTLQGIIPTMKDTSLVSNLPRSTQTDLVYYVDQGLFYSSKSFDNPYNMSYVLYDFDPQVLSKATVKEKAQYLSVPDSLTGKLKGLAENVTKNASSPYEKAKALESFLKSNFVYNQNITAVPNGIDPVEWFLFHDKKGICTQFNTAFVLMARTLGLPARLVGGYLIDSTKEAQEVTQQDSHAYSEILFNEGGWMIFDATAPVINKVEVEPNFIERQYNQSDIPGYITTSTTILSNNKIGVKGDNFTVTGTVTSRNRQRISGLVVQIALAKYKVEKGTTVGEGIVKDGVFNITCTIPSSISLGAQNVIAKTLGNGVYNGSSSDPIITVMTRTTIDLIIPNKVIYGRSFFINGTLKEYGTEKPISNMTLTLDVDTLPRTLITDINGNFSIPMTLSGYGMHNVTANFLGLEYYLDSSNEKQVKVPEFSIIPLSGDIIRGENNSLAPIVMAADLPVEKEDVLISMNGTEILDATTDTNGYIDTSYSASPSLMMGNVTFDYKLIHFNHVENRTVKVMAKTFISVETTNFLGNQIEITSKLVDNLKVPVIRQNLTANTNITDASSVGMTNSEGKVFFKLEAPALVRVDSVACNVMFNGSKYLLPSALTVIIIPQNETTANIIGLLLAISILAIVGISITMFSLNNQKRGKRTLTMPAIETQEQVDSYRRQSLISFPQIREPFTLVWGEREPFQVLVRYNITQGKVACLIVDDGKMEKLELKTYEDLREFILEKGIHTFAIVEGNNKIAKVKVRIVDYREEVVRLYSKYFFSVKRKSPKIIEETTPREFESIARESIPSNKHDALDSVVSLFEVANYSLHTIARRHYEKMYARLLELKRNES
jgi:hypothetical protein